MTGNVTPPADAQAPATDTTASTNTDADTNNEPAAQTTDVGQTTDQPTLTAEQIKEYQDWKKYIDSNGGFDKLKQTVSTKVDAQTAADAQTQAPANVAPTQQAPEVQNNPQPVPKGKMTMEALATQQYMAQLASEERYAAIADDIRSGKLMKEMAEGPVPVFAFQDGMFNDSQVRWYLDMKAASVAAQQTTTAPQSTAPTVEYANIQEVKTYDDASKIMLQNMELKKLGMAPHPQTEAAKKFMKEFYASRNK